MIPLFNYMFNRRESNFDVSFIRDKGRIQQRCKPFLHYPRIYNKNSKIPIQRVLRICNISRGGLQPSITYINEKSLLIIFPLRIILKYRMLHQISNSDIMRLGYILQSALHRAYLSPTRRLGRLIGSPRVPRVLTRS